LLNIKGGDWLQPQETWNDAFWLLQGDIRSTTISTDKELEVKPNQNAYLILNERVKK